jgi:hypothetical protein
MVMIRERLTAAVTSHRQQRRRADPQADPSAAAAPIAGERLSIDRGLLDLYCRVRGASAHRLNLGTVDCGR